MNETGGPQQRSRRGLLWLLAPLALVGLLVAGAWWVRSHQTESRDIRDTPSVSLPPVDSALSARVTACEEALRLAPGDYSRHVALARAYLEAGRVHEAQRAMPPLQAGDPPEAVLLWGRLYASLGQYAEASRHLVAARKALPNSPAPALALVEVLSSLGKRGAAGRLARENAQAHPNSYEAQVCAAQVAIETGAYRGDTATFLARARQLDNSRPEALALEALMRRTEPVVAERLAREALSRDPASPQALLALGWVKARAEPTAANVREAERCLKQVSLLRPQSPLPARELGRLYRDLGRLDEAYEWQRRATELAPRAASSWYALAAVCADLGRDEEAARHRQRARELADSESREETLVQRLQKSPQDGDARARLAELYAEQGRWQEAVAQANEVLATEPTQQAARQVLRRAMEATAE